MGEIWHRRMGDAQQGLALYERALEADPEHVDALRGVARIRAERGEAAEAAAALEKVVERTARAGLRGARRVELARLYGGPLGQPERAAELYRSALTQDPRCEEALEALCEDARRKRASGRSSSSSWSAASTSRPARRGGSRSPSRPDASSSSTCAIRRARASGTAAPSSSRPTTTR